ncbi:MAG: UDP binding domain-containing protein [Microbacteriaceae bacterium]
MRDTPALDVAVQLHGLGANVVATDPEATETSRRLHPQLMFEPDTAQALSGADAVVLVTEWQQYRELDPAACRALVGNAVIVDGRNCLDPAAWRAAGWQYRGLGRP